MASVVLIPKTKANALGVQVRQINRIDTSRCHTMIGYTHWIMIRKCVRYFWSLEEPCLATDQSLSWKIWQSVLILASYSWKQRVAMYSSQNTEYGDTTAIQLDKRKLKTFPKK